MVRDSSPGYGSEIAALRNACLEVQKCPWDAEAAITLVRLASSVMRFHDTVQGSPHEDSRREEMNRLVGLLVPVLNAADASEVKRLLPDIMQDMPQTERAARRLRPILSTLGKATYDVAIRIITDIASETAKKLLGLSVYTKRGRNEQAAPCLIHPVADRPLGSCRTVSKAPPIG